MSLALHCMKLSCISRVPFSDRINKPPFPQSCLGVILLWTWSVFNIEYTLTQNFQTNYMNVYVKYLNETGGGRDYRLKCYWNHNNRIRSWQAAFQSPVKKSQVNSGLVWLFFFVLDHYHLHQPIHIHPCYVCIHIRALIRARTCLCLMSLGLCLGHG